MQELTRVADHVFVTTPNRWFPLELHTGVPLLHWLPPARFRAALRTLGKDFYASEETLDLLDEKSLTSMVPPGWHCQYLHQQLFGWTSNLVIFIEK